MAGGSTDTIGARVRPGSFVFKRGSSILNEQLLDKILGNKPNKYAGGGTVPINVTDGERIATPEEVGMYGIDFFRAINNSSDSAAHENIDGLIAMAELSNMKPMIGGGEVSPGYENGYQYGGSVKPKMGMFRQQANRKPLGMPRMGYQDGDLVAPAIDEREFELRELGGADSSFEKFIKNMKYVYEPERAKQWEQDWQEEDAYLSGEKMVPGLKAAPIQQPKTWTKHYDVDDIDALKKWVGKDALFDKTTTNDFSRIKQGGMIDFLDLDKLLEMKYGNLRGIDSPYEAFKEGYQEGDVVENKKGVLSTLLGMLTGAGRRQKAAGRRQRAYEELVPQADLPAIAAKMALPKYPGREHYKEYPSVEQDLSPEDIWRNLMAEAEEGSDEYTGRRANMDDRMKALLALEEEMIRNDPKRWNLMRHKDEMGGYGGFIPMDSEGRPLAEVGYQHGDLVQDPNDPLGIAQRQADPSMSAGSVMQGAGGMAPAGGNVPGGAMYTHPDVMARQSLPELLQMLMMQEAMSSLMEARKSSGQIQPEKIEMSNEAYPLQLLNGMQSKYTGKQEPYLPIYRDRGF